MSALLKKVRRELDELDNITCDSESGSVEKAWIKWLYPGVSPRGLHKSVYKATAGLPPPEIAITFNVDNGDRPPNTLIHISGGTGKNAYEMEVHLNEGSLHFNNITIPDTIGNQGHASKMVQWLANLAKAVDKPTITMKATLTNGAYTWARFGFTPTVNDWNGLKKQLVAYRLSDDHSRIHFRHHKGQDGKPAHVSQYEKNWPNGFDLTKREVEIIHKALASKKPEDIWRISDLGRELARIDRGEGNPPHIITVGKALLCGLEWEGALDLKAGMPGYDRFTSYISRAPERSPRPSQASL